MLQEWPEEVYPPYANGPGYVISSDIAKFVVLQHGNQSLRVCNTESFYLFPVVWMILSVVFSFVATFCTSFLSTTEIYRFFLVAALQDGGCEYGNVG